MERLYTVAEAAEAIRMSERWVQLKMQSRELSYVKLGSSVRIAESEIERFIAEKTVNSGESE